MSAVGPFRSILFARPESEVGDVAEPEFFRDLNLDQVVKFVTAGRDGYDLKPFFYAPLHDVADVGYRHDVLRDLDSSAVQDSVDTFAQHVHRVRRQLAQAGKLHYQHQKRRWFLDATSVYCDAVVSFTNQLREADLRSEGMQALRDYVVGYVRSEDFRTLVSDTRRCLDDLSKVKHRIQIRGPRVDVSRYDGDADYSAEVEKTFARFAQGAGKDYRVKFREDAGMNHVQAQILDCVARLFPDTFRELGDYCERHGDFFDATIGRFGHEVQFYLGYLALMRRIRSAGLDFSYPEMSTASHDMAADEAFDLALAIKLVGDDVPLVCNSFELSGEERVIVVSGPNNGGKTTFARMFGQLAYLGSLGLPVPAAAARLFLPDRLFSHFEREEQLATLRGKLDDELVRIHDILRQATSDSVIVMNESFASTTLHDARFIGTKVLHEVLRLRARAVYVTFVDELASLDAATVSMVSAVVPGEPARRTYKVTRRPADGLAYAAAIAEKYGLTYDSLRRRLAR